MEIERRWLLSTLPPQIIALPSITIVQGYARCLNDELTVASHAHHKFGLNVHVPATDGHARETWRCSIPLWVFDHLSLAKNYGKARIRQINGKRWELTIKGPGDISREEWETIVPERVGRFLFLRSESRVLFKNRTPFPDSSFKLEFDDFHQRHEGHKTVECEFKTKPIAEAYVLPAWVGAVREITHEKCFSGYNLAVNGLPHQHLSAP